ncbi:MAG: InlB B-repeat-containing protein [Clostridia bacterium]|nr:InlB B-repeat-containing protein [Clostridia bacterium]
MKKHIISRTLSFLLALTLIFAAAPLSAFGAGTGDESESESATATTYGSMADTFSDLYWLLFVKPFLKPSASGEGLPENAKLSFETVSNPFNRKTGSVNYDFLDFYDIKAVDKQTGKEIHPIGEVEVTITDARIKDNQSVFLLHILDDENVIRNSKNYVLKTDPAFVSAFPAAAKAAEKATGKTGVAVEIIDDLAVDGNDITFKTSSFSIFIIAENPILTVNFYKGPADDANKIVSIRVKKSDTEGYPSTSNPPVETEFEKIVYDPGVNSGLDEDILFRGWFENNEYTAEDAVRVTDPPADPAGAYVSGAMTIADVRDKIAAILNDTAFNGGEKDFYAMLFRQYTVTYFDQAGKVCLGRDFVLQRAYSADGSDIALNEMDYQVTLTYVPYGQFENFEGWKLKTGDKTEGDGYYNTQAQHMLGIYTTEPDGTPDITGEEAREHIYTTPTWTRISGDIYLQAESPEGNWLVFDENGKGATYVAPQFVKKGQNTISPHATNADLGYPVTMQRYGYEFGGWFTTKAAADANTVKYEDWGATPPNGAFTFGQQLNDNITIYASWISHTTATYTVIIWKQNINADGYDFYESIPLTGNVGQTVDTVTQVGNGNDAYVVVDGRTIRLTGFHLKDVSPNVVISTENNSVVHVRFDRTEYTITLRDTGGTSHYEYTPTDSQTGTQYGYVNGQYVQLTRSAFYSVDGSTSYTGYGYMEATSNSNNNTYYGVVNGAVVTLSRRGNGTYNNPYYWVYNNNQTYTGTRYLRYNNNTIAYYFNGYEWYGFDSATGTMKRVVQVVNWSYNGQPYTGTRYTRSTTTNVTVKTITALYQQDISSYFPVQGDNGVNYTGYVWDPQNSSIYTTGQVPYIEAMREENTVFMAQRYGTGTMIHMYYYTEALPGEAYDVTYGGKNYIEHQHVQISANGEINSTRAEDFSDINGFTQYASNPAYGANGQVALNYNNSYTIRFYYTRNNYAIHFMDGTYVDGNNNVQDEINRGSLATSEQFAYGANISEYNNYKLDNYQGYVFEGWYLDETCTQPCNFTTMPEGGITVYAKWRQIQYRVFLHPNAGTGDNVDETLDWGSDTQSMNFRISYGGTISVPTGLRHDYIFAGWYTDPGLTQSFIPATRLNEQTVTTPYDKTTDFTDKMDKWGRLTGDADHDGPWNSDLTGYNGGDRFWITKRFDLYAKWRAKIVGADGMYVKFVTTDDEGRVGHFASGTANTNAALTEYCDGDIYADGAFSYGLAACDAPAVAEGADELHFRYWVVQRWDASENSFFDSDVIVYPGERFDTVYQYAQRIDIDPSDPEYNKPGTEGYDETKPDYYYKYYMVLRAEYTPAVPAETTVRYHANGGVWQDVITGRTLPAYGSGADVVNYAPVPGYAEGDTETYYGFNIEVNKEFNILQNTAAQTVVEKEGYNFLGWSFTRITADADVETFKQTLATETAEGYEGERTVFAGDGSDPVVGADLRPDEANVLYAVWEPRTFDVIVKKVIANFQMTDDTWNQHGFMFYYSVTKDGETLVADTLVKEGGVSVNGSANTGDTDTVIIANVPYGATLSIWEVLQEGGEQTLFLTDHDADNKIEIVLNDELALKDDGRTLAAPAVITNTGALGTIIVSKTVNDKNGTEFANEKFVFKLERLTSADGAVDATFAPVYFTLKDTGSVSFQVPSGYYQVTELDDWSWRYKAQGDTVKKCTIDQDNSTAQAKFTNKRNDMNWLSGENSADNTFVVSNGR